MKFKIIYFLILIIIQASSFAQNIGIGTSNPANQLEVISAVGNQGLASILGTNNGTTGTAIIGVSNASNTRGVVGSSTNGFGVQGYTNNNIAISGFSFSGTALSASSNTGYALQVSGNLKFAGGNTNPADGALLTSDAIGNATWKKSKAAFLVAGNLPNGFSNGVFRKVEFVNEKYDLNNNLEDYNSGTTPATSSMFTAPVAGVYHFSAIILFSKIALSNFFFIYADIKLVKNQSSNAMAIFRGQPFTSASNSNRIYLQITGNFHLDANDKVWIEALQSNSLGTNEGLSSIEATSRFSGHLVVAD